MLTRLLILDRDGVINRESADFIKSPAEFQPLPGSIEAIARLSQAGYTVAVATNQSGLARGHLERDTLYAIHRKFRRAVYRAGGKLGRIVYCPHGPDEGCACRKPEPGLLIRLASLYGVPLQGVPFVGDSRRDIIAAERAGARPILVLTGNGEQTQKELAAENKRIEVATDLAAVADMLVADMLLAEGSTEDNAQGI